MPRLQAKVVEILEAQMTKNEKVLKRALELAAHWFYEDNGCEGCPLYTLTTVGLCTKINCEGDFKDYFIRIAKEELK